MTAAGAQQVDGKGSGSARAANPRTGDVAAGDEDRNYGDYPELLALSGLTLLMVGVAPVCMRRARRRRASDGGRTTAGPDADNTPT